MVCRKREESGNLLKSEGMTPDSGSVKKYCSTATATAAFARSVLCGALLYSDRVLQCFVS
jgi:hypothetical protein